MKKLYRQFPAYNKGFLKVSDIHQIYFEESGNPQGNPVIVIHGGPGSKSKPRFRKFFDPKKWRVVLFDQRGCGKSKPLGETKNNTTWDLINDIERIRKHLKVSKWVIFGGSWGSTLSLAYAKKHPTAIAGLILRSIWLCRKKDIRWLLIGKGLRIFFPDLWEWRVKSLEKLGIRVNNPLEQLHQKLFRGTKKEQKLATLIFQNWEGQFLKVDQKPKLMKENEVTEKHIAAKKILMHYVINDCFFKPNQLMKEINKLPKVPMVIIQGRYDVICPIDQAWRLYQALPHAKLEMVPAAGHHSSEPGIADKLIRYTDKFSNQAY